MLKRLFGWFSSGPIDRSLRAKVTLGIAIPLIIILGSYTAVDYSRYRSDLLRHLSTMASYNGQLIVGTLQHAMVTSNFNDVQAMLDMIGKNQNFRIVYLLDTTGTVIFAPNKVGIGINLDNRNPSCRPCHDLVAAERPSGIVVNSEDGEQVFRSMQPIENGPECSSCHDPQEPVIGLLLTDIYTAPFEASLSDDLRGNLIWAIIMILVTLIVVNLAISYLVITPVVKVAEALGLFGSGKRDIRFKVDRADEIGQLESDFNEMVLQIQTEESTNLALSEDLKHQTARQQDLLKGLITAQEDERKRVARELHDDLGQSLSGLALHLEAAQQFVETDPDRALEQLSLTREMINSTTQQMYELIMALRPSVLDELGLAAALRSLAKRVLPADRFVFTLESDQLKNRLQPSIETALYRIFQEALSNIVRHSAADRVNITLSQRGRVFEGEISDNGKGINLETGNRETDHPHGLGILGMQERVAQVGGTIDIKSGPGEGTRISIRIPLGESDHE